MICEMHKTIQFDKTIKNTIVQIIIENLKDMEIYFIQRNCKEVLAFIAYITKCKKYPLYYINDMVFNKFCKLYITLN